MLSSSLPVNVKVFVGGLSVCQTMIMYYLGSGEQPTIRYEKCVAPAGCLRVLLMNIHASLLPCPCVKSIREDLTNTRKLCHFRHHKQPTGSHITYHTLCEYLKYLFVERIGSSSRLVVAHAVLHNKLETSQISAINFSVHMPKRSP